MVKIKINNFKSIKDSDDIAIDEGLYVLVGKNSSGKSAILQALNILNTYIRQLSSSIDTQYYFRYNNPFTLEVTCDLPKELLNHFQSYETPRLLDQIKFIFSGKGYMEVQLKRVDSLEWLNMFNSTNVLQSLFLRPNGEITWNQILSSVSLIENKHSIQNLSIQNHVLFNDLRTLLTNKIPEMIYIPAFRQINPNNTLDTERILQPDGNNLHNVLSTINSDGNDHLMPLQDFITEIFPQYSKILFRKLKEGSQSISEIYLVDKITGHLIPLRECGAGVGQLILLAALVILRTGKTLFLLDEPHSFLHPEAEKKLITFLSNSNHLYFIATHSMTMINKVESDKIILVTMKDDHSVVKKLTTKDSYKNEILEAIGITNSDLALKDKIIFVEGETEEEIFPNLLNICGFEIDKLNIAIINVFGKDKDKNYIKIHERYKEIFNISIPHIFVKDNDGINKEDQANIIYLDVNEIENYFLGNPRAILEAIQKDFYVEKLIKDEPNSDFAAKIINLNVDELQTVINNKIKERLYNTSLPFEEQRKRVKGSDVLTDVFNYYDVRYTKTQHAKIIVKHLIPEDLIGLRIKLQSFLEVKENNNERDNFLRILAENNIDINKAKRYLEAL